MGNLRRHGVVVRSVFDLLGDDENDLTAALGFTLNRCPAMLASFLARVCPAASNLVSGHAEAHIALEVRGAQGRTDLEVSLPGNLVVVEAKRAWQLPAIGQLEKYAGRVHAWGGGVLVTLSQASQALARVQLPAQIDGIPVVHLPWRDVLTDLGAIKDVSHGTQHQWLKEFRTYLKRVIRIKSVADSWTYCVVVSSERPGGGGARTFRQFVTEENTYFHPYGTSGWPLDPPNFLAFRWGGAVRSIHRVMHADVIADLAQRWPDIPVTAETARPHAVYSLGPQLPPHEPVPNGAAYRASRLWVLLDQLQVCSTLAEAVANTRSLNS
jgi:hypothetical protein